MRVCPHADEMEHAGGLGAGNSVDARNDIEQNDVERGDAGAEVTWNPGATSGVRRDGAARTAEHGRSRTDDVIGVVDDVEDVDVVEDEEAIGVSDGGKTVEASRQDRTAWPSNVGIMTRLLSGSFSSASGREGMGGTGEGGVREQLLYKTQYPSDDAYLDDDTDDAYPDNDTDDSAGDDTDDHRGGKRAGCTGRRLPPRSYRPPFSGGHGGHGGKCHRDPNASIYQEPGVAYLTLVSGPAGPGPGGPTNPAGNVQVNATNDGQYSNRTNTNNSGDVVANATTTTTNNDNTNNNTNNINNNNNNNINNTTTATAARAKSRRTSMYKNVAVMVAYAAVIAAVVFALTPRKVEIGTVAVVPDGMRWSQEEEAYTLRLNVTIPTYNPNFLPYQLKGDLRVMYYDAQAGNASMPVHALVPRSRAAAQVVVDASRLDQRYVLSVLSQCSLFPHVLTFFLEGEIWTRRRFVSWDYTLTSQIETWFFVNCGV